MRPSGLSFLLLLGSAAAAPAQSTPSPEEKIAALEKKADALSQQIAGLDARLEKRWQLLPSATIWITRDFQVSRTAVPEYYSKHLAWVIIRDGREILQRNADNEMTLGLLAADGHLPGNYVVFLSTWIDGTHRPISNVLAFQIPADPASPAPSSSPTPSPPPPPDNPSIPPHRDSSLNSRFQHLNQRLDVLAERTAEYRAYCEQQRTLPRTLDLWMDADLTLRRTVGPEDIETKIQWEITGPDSLSRNAIGEVALEALHWQTGRYQARVVSNQKSVSNSIAYDIIQPPDAPSEDNDAEADSDNDGLKNRDDAVPWH